MVLELTLFVLSFVVGLVSLEEVPDRELMFTLSEPLLRAELDKVLSLSGGKSLCPSMGMAKGVGLVDAIPSVAALCESLRRRLEDRDDVSSP